MMMSMSFILTYLLIGASCSEPSPFRIVIDAGSTGSRLHIFEFINNDEGNVKSMGQIQYLQMITKRHKVAADFIA